MENITLSPSSTSSATFRTSSSFLLSPTRLIATPPPIGKDPKVKELRTNLKPLGDKDPKSGKHGSVFVVTPATPYSSFSSSSTSSLSVFASPTSVSTKSKRYAVKKQQLRNPKDPNDIAYRELRILGRLSQLHDENRCFNFVRYYDHAKTSALFSEEEEAREVTSQDEQNLYIVMECADETLFERARKPLSIGSYREILFQVLYALVVAQDTLKFMHNDLHLRNILLKKLPAGTHCKLHDPRTEKKKKGENNKDKNEKPGTSWYLLRGELVKLADFGVSRAEVREGEVLCHRPSGNTNIVSSGTGRLSSRNSGSESSTVRMTTRSRGTGGKGDSPFIASSDIEKLATEFGSIKLQVTTEDLVDELEWRKLRKERQKEEEEEEEEIDKTTLLRQEKAKITNLRKKMWQSIGTPVIEFLHHEFFEPLTFRRNSRSLKKTTTVTSSSLLPFSSPVSGYSGGRYALQASLDGILPPGTPIYNKEGREEEEEKENELFSSIDFGLKKLSLVN
jgi:hypothetical protein